MSDFTLRKIYVVQSFGACRGEKCVAKPVGLWLPGGADGFHDFSCFVRRQSNREDDGWPFHRKSGSPYFLFHTDLVFRLRKCLTAFLAFVYKTPVSNFGTSLSPKEMAGTAAGESELTSSLPVSAGASHRESEMKSETIQVRSLAIEATGDFFGKKITHKIRLAGRWLERAGFKPGHRVEVCIDQPGSLTIRFLEQRQEVAL